MLKGRLIVVCFSFACGFIFSSVKSDAQNLSPVVLNSGGGYYSATWGNLTYSIGEPITLTLSSSSILTQGFQQPTIDSALINALLISAKGHPPFCRNGKNGYGTVIVISGKAPYTYIWYPSGGNKDTTTAIPSGTYTVTVRDNAGQLASEVVTINDGSTNCLPTSQPIKIYSGLTPNGDNYNDQWLIDGIHDFPENHVAIFNRWGNKVWEGSNYDNNSVVWNGSDKNGNKLTDGTYFYIVNIPDAQFKGWVELTR